MAKGIFTQGVCILMSEPPSLDDVERCLGDFEILKRLDQSSPGSWPMGGPSLVLAYLPDVNGVVQVDIVDHPWPDHMGSQEEPEIFGAWAMGYFGPFAYPDGLQRAAQQCWAWSDAETIPEKHQAFLRVRCSYSFGVDDDDPVMPPDYDPRAELDFITKIVNALLQLQGALCYFNPNGEVLLNEETLRECLNFGWQNELPPLEAWTNVRLFEFDDDWTMMDSVGNWQLEVPDIEACFSTDGYDCNDVAMFLRSVTTYIIENGDVIEEGHTIDGPGEVQWEAYRFPSSISDPPRATIRLFPDDGHEIPEPLLTMGRDEEDDDEEE